MTADPSLTPHASPAGQRLWRATGRRPSNVRSPWLSSDQIDRSRAPLRNDIAYAVVYAVPWCVLAFWHFGDTLITADDGAAISWYFDAGRGVIAAVLVVLLFGGIGLGLRRLIMPTARWRKAQTIGRNLKAGFIGLDGLATGLFTFAGLERWLAPGIAISVGLALVTGIAVGLIVGIALSFVVDIPPHVERAAGDEK